MHAGTFPSGLLCPHNGLNFDQQLPHLPSLHECATNKQFMEESWGIMYICETGLRQWICNIGQLSCTQQNHICCFKRSGAPPQYD